MKRLPLVSVLHDDFEVPISMETRKFLPRVGAKAGGRLGNHKERTGCLTCKKRKIKCDEDKPACYRCSSTGRQCEGYAASSTRIIVKRTPSPQFSVLAGVQLELHPWSDVDEHQAFESFCHSGAFAVGCQTDFDLWSRGIPQLTHSYPAIKHATIAAGALLRMQKRQHVWAPTQAQTKRPDDTAESFAIRHYHKAIQLTLLSIERRSGDARLAGITCVLFFCIEALQGHEKEALALFERGHRAQLRPQAFQHAEDEVSSGLAESFSRLAVQWSMFEGSVADATDYPMHLDGPIHTMAQAQQEITRLILLVFNVVSDGFPLKWSAQFDLCPNQGKLKSSRAWSVLKAREEGARNSLQIWYIRFVEYRQRAASDKSTVSEIACREMLLLRYVCLQFWLLGSTEQSEVMYDDYLPQFKEAVALAETCIELMEQCGMVVPFSFELGVIPPLHIIILKCRDPVVRREALQLLRRAPAQEGLWNRDIVSQVAERVIELEEGSDSFIETLPPDMAKMVVPDNMRLKMVKINLRTTHEDGRRGDHVEFYALPYGLNKEWSVTREFFAVSSPLDSRKWKD